MGDLPIYLGFDSADVWEHQEVFLLDENQNPTFVAGVPPDFFSETGQLWGNPLYNWDRLQEANFDFWIERLEGNFRLFDIVRINHFRAFDTYWKIPASAKTAVTGKWVETPGYDFFDTVYKRIPNANIIAYSGTHDNNTLKGWYFDELNRYQRKLLKRYFKANNNNIFRKIVKYLLSCTAKYVILPLQDILELDSEARLNTPGTVGSPNWQWKLVDFSSLKIKAAWLSQQLANSKRC